MPGRRAVLGVLAGAAALACGRAPEGPADAAEAPRWRSLPRMRACKDALHAAELAEPAARAGVVAAGCAGLFRKDACAAAWREAGAAAPKAAADLLTHTCAEAYCAALTPPAPLICQGEAGVAPSAADRAAFFEAVLVHDFGTHAVSGLAKELLGIVATD